MFEDTINNLRRTKESFGSQVRDSFGESIVGNVIEPLEGEEEKLYQAYEAAKAKMAEIKVITAELLLIV